MDGSSRRLLRSTQRKPALQLRPQPRFIVPPAAPGGAINTITPFVRPIPAPINPVTAVPTTVLPRLGLVGLAFGLGFFVGDALINPLIGQESVFDWGVFNQPEDAGSWLTQPALPEGMTVTTNGDFGADGAWLIATFTYGDSRVSGDGCTDAITRGPTQGPRVKVTRTGGQLRWRGGDPSGTGCGAAGYALEVLRTTPSNPANADWLPLVSINTANWSPEGGVTEAEFEVEFEPDGLPQGFIPLPAYAPARTIPRTVPEPLPQVEPETQPERKPVIAPPIPMAPPNVRPIPSPVPTPLPQPQVPPAPTPIPTQVPTPTIPPPPNIPDTLTTPITNAGELAPRPGPGPAPTPPNYHFPVNGAPPVTTGGVRSSMNAIAAEIGRVEQKVAQNMQKTKDIPWWMIPAILDLLSAFLETDIQGTTYSLTGVCEQVEEGEEQPTAEFPVAPARNLMAIINRLDVMDDMLQQHLAWRTPTCRTRPQLQGDWRTISFISDETSPYGKSRLRKRLRYRSMSGLGLGDVIDHWANFTWTAGPVCVIHSGASWGTPQVWASTVDEGKRVIRHAAGESGLDPDQVGEWTVSGSSSPRIGVSGTMRVNQTGGFYWITARDGSEGRPIVGRV